MRRLCFLLLLCVHTAGAQDKGLSEYVAESKKFYTAKDFASAYDQMAKAHQLHPYHQGILYQLGILGALTEKPAEAVSNLKKAVLINAGYKLTDNPDLASLKDRQDFQELVALQKKLLLPVVHSDTAFTVADRALHIESIALNPVSGTFYLGSIHKRKIIAVDKKGKTSDFTQPGEFGLTSVFGIKVDSKTKTLWACSSPMKEMENYDSTASSLVSAFDLTTGKIKTQFRPTTKTGHVFGDLAINPNGEVFVSDSKNNVIFKVNRESKTLDLFFESTEFWNLQGLTFSDDGQYLFIADYIKGPFRLNVSTRVLDKVKSEVDLSLKGIDGLTFYRGSLIAIQNGTYPFRTTRFTLNPALDTFVKSEILDQAHPAFNEPTLGIVAKDTFYYVANSQWGGYSDNHQIKDVASLQDIVILKVNLQGKR